MDVFLCGFFYTGGLQHVLHIHSNIKNSRLFLSFLLVDILDGFINLHHCLPIVSYCLLARKLPALPTVESVDQEDSYYYI